MIACLYDCGSFRQWNIGFSTKTKNTANDICAARTRVRDATHTDIDRWKMLRREYKPRAKQNQRQSPRTHATGNCGLNAKNASTRMVQGRFWKINGFRTPNGTGFIGWLQSIGAKACEARSYKRLLTGYWVAERGNHAVVRWKSTLRIERDVVTLTQKATVTPLSFSWVWNKVTFRQSGKQQKE